MKTSLKVCVMGLIAGLSLGVFNASANLEVSAGVQIHAVADFYAPLTPYGAWVEVGSYGRCWHPAQVAVEWRPYGYGHWVWTDCGWYWESDEPWAWACYHYGRWVSDPSYGWVWVPEVEWSPAWVYWRVGGDYIGWAPCPPRGIVVAPALFVFVDLHRFSDPVRPSSLIVNNTTIINKTTQITEIRRETRTIDGTRQRVVINQGPGVDPIQKATGKTVTAVPIREAVSRTPVPSTLKGGTPPPTGKETPRVFQEQPKTQPQHERPPSVAPEPAPRSAPPQGATPPSKERVVPSPERPTVPTAPPEKPPGPPTGSEKGRVYPESKPPHAPPAERPPGPPVEKEKGHEKDKEHP